jgi:hypothetical protein
VSGHPAHSQSIYSSAELSSGTEELDEEAELWSESALKSPYSSAPSSLFAQSEEEEEETASGMSVRPSW